MLNTDDTFNRIKTLMTGSYDDVPDEYRKLFETSPGPTADLRLAACILLLFDELETLSGEIEAIKRELHPEDY